MIRAAHRAERIRDVPRSCLCAWQWDNEHWRWVLRWMATGCPWHSGGK